MCRGAESFDALEGAGHVFVGIRCCWIVVDDLNALDNHVEWTLGKVGQSTCPLDCARRISWRSCDPIAEADVHWCLRIV